MDTKREPGVMTLLSLFLFIIIGFVTVFMTWAGPCSYNPSVIETFNKTFKVLLSITLASLSVLVLSLVQTYILTPLLAPTILVIIGSSNTFIDYMGERLAKWTERKLKRQ